MDVKVYTVEKLRGDGYSLEITYDIFSKKKEDIENIREIAQRIGKIWRDTNDTTTK